jgi:UDP-GlcNAc:undecaprenyl-phosphate GlcNAc-1-phosphate transferase
MDLLVPIYRLPVWVYYLLVLVVSLTASLLLTPVARALALRLDIVDHPGGRKIHSTVIPYLGGLAIFSAFWIAMALLSIQPYQQQLATIIGGGTIVMLLGLWDDNSGMNPLVKISGQLMAAMWVAQSGIQFHLTGDALLDLGLTLLWIVGLTNATNLLDNMDGLSSGAALISSGFLWIIAAWNGQFLVASMALALVGACLGFLRYNFAPATIFMGDAGSLFLGYTLSVIALKLRPSVADPWLSFLIPVVLLGLPILDTTLVTCQRILHGRPFYLGGRDHSSHRLVAVGHSRTAAVILLYVVSGVYGLLALGLNAAGAQPLLILGALAFSGILFVKLSQVDVYGAGHDSGLSEIAKKG